MQKRLSIVMVALLVVALLPTAAFAAPRAKGAPAPTGIKPQVVLLPDAYEPDDTTATATDIDEIGYGTTRHTLPHRTASEGIDYDWVKFTADETGQPFILQSTYVDGYLDMWMYIYEPNPDGTMTQLDYDDDMVYFEGYGSELFFVAPHPGDFYVENYARDDNFGTYDLFVDSALARRVAGPDRYATSVAISKTMWPDTTNPSYDWGPENIIVANDGTIDALTGGAFGASFGWSFDEAPLLLTKKDVLPTVVKNEITRLSQGATNDESPVTVWILGGTDKVSDGVMKQIEELPYVYAVKRIAGNNRYATAAAIASEAVAATDIDDTVFIANGADIPDALSASALTQLNAAPILLTAKAQLSNETSQWLADHPGIVNAIVLGGEDQVSTATVGALEDMGLSVDRVAGANRYQTSAMLAQYAIDNYSASPDDIVIASGQKFADGLCGGPMAAMAEAPLLLTPGASLATSITEYYDENPTSNASYILGGYPTISEDVELDFNSLWVPEEIILTGKR